MCWHLYWSIIQPLMWDLFPLIISFHDRQTVRRIIGITTTNLCLEDICRTFGSTQRYWTLTHRTWTKQGQATVSKDRKVLKSTVYLSWNWTHYRIQKCRQESISDYHILHFPYLHCPCYRSLEVICTYRGLYWGSWTQLGIKVSWWQKGTYIGYGTKELINW